MKTVQESLIRALSDHLAGRATIIPVDLNWEELMKLSEKHQVSGIMYAQCKNPLFQSAFYSTIACYLKRKEALVLFEESLRKYDLDYFLVKGPIIAEHYPVPALRTMGDVDVIVHPEDRKRVSEILCDLDFRTDGILGIYEWSFRYGNLMFELHDHLVYNQVANEEIHKKFFNDCWKYVRKGGVDPSFHFLFLVFHLRKHFMNSGVGIRQFMDVAVMEREELNWPWIEKKLRELELWAFSEKVFALNKAWFGVEPPLPVVPAEQSFLDEATEMILSNGVFGFHNEANEKNIGVNIVMADGGNFLARIRQVFHVILYPYSNMIVMPQYSYLKYRKYLLPAAWVHRALRAVYLKRADKTMKYTMKKAFVSRAVVEERSKVLKKWGL